VHAEAVEFLRSALKEREKWPPETRRFHGLDDVRDYYLLAMAHRGLAEKLGGDLQERFRSKEYLDMAEAGIHCPKGHYKYSEIVYRIRDFALARMKGP